MSRGAELEEAQRSVHAWEAELAEAKAAPAPAAAPAALRATARRRVALAERALHKARHDVAEVHVDRIAELLEAALATASAAELARLGQAIDAYRARYPRSWDGMQPGARRLLLAAACAAAAQ